ncbi:MAG: hypothetical protein V7784_20450 [Oceanospirillaceae bacterium]
MRYLKSIITTSILLGTLSPLAAFADIKTDIAAEQPMKVIFDNALTNNTGLDDIFNQIAAAQKALTPDATTYATCNKLDANTTIVSYAFAAAPDLAQDIANAARACGATEEELLNSALASNIDPTTIGEATAAGGPAAAPGVGVATPSFGTAGGTGGGGVASAG